MRQENLSMWRIYQFPLCPFSRKVRLLMRDTSAGADEAHRRLLRAKLGK